MAKERVKTTAERGKFKTAITTALFKNENIRELLLGDTSGKSAAEIQKQFKHYVKSHLFIDDTITEAATFIYYDISIPEIHAQTKNCKLLMYLICDRAILEDYAKEGYYGDRIDCLAQMVEETLVCDEEVAKKFGIGLLDMDSIGMYNGTRFYGCVITFDIPTFRYTVS